MFRLQQTLQPFFSRSKLKPVLRTSLQTSLWVNLLTDSLFSWEQEASAGASRTSSAPPGRRRGKPALSWERRPGRRGCSWGRRSEGGRLCVRGPPEPRGGAGSRREAADEPTWSRWTWETRRRERCQIMMRISISSFLFSAIYINPSIAGLLTLLLFQQQ